MSYVKLCFDIFVKVVSFASVSYLLPHHTSCMCLGLLNIYCLFSRIVSLGDRLVPFLIHICGALLFNIKLWLLILEEEPFHLGFLILLFQDSLALINMLLSSKN